MKKHDVEGLTTMERAVTDTLRMYEACIEDPKGMYKVWADMSCRVCMAHEYQPCSMCPLYNWSHFCEENEDGFSIEPGAQGYIVDCREDRTLKAAFTARYNELLRRLKQNGWEYK